MSNPADNYYNYPQKEIVLTDTGVLDQVFGIIDRYGVSLLQYFAVFGSYFT